MIEEIKGQGKITRICSKDTATGETSYVDLSGIKIYPGLWATTRILHIILPMGNDGGIPTDLWMATGVWGMFTTGDILQQPAAQLATCT